MPGHDAFLKAVFDLSAAGAAGTNLCLPFVEGLPIIRAAISTLGDPFGSETVCASDDEAARLDELQIDLGEGPCWQALSSRRPVIEPDIQNSPNPDWPTLSASIQDAGVRAVFAFPLLVGSLRVGAVDLYADTVGTLTPGEIDDAATLAGIAARHIVSGALERNALEQPPSVFSRREVHQATGMVLTQLGVSAADALLIIRAHAFAEGLTVREVAATIVDRRLIFGHGSTPNGT
ncbi:GAF and ANTAR domain-containing protein [Subtercola endophyticus]|uniref:GAF and ANTAR domain-containing protein n=1 Tax=Subtercola endophyticus TaxID=2895559 RepID=UPI001E37F2C8|nr:GAF and ANTAR domain-containing protein [Subtercola endophyticus]UFS57518.1 GAF and ANTAR domain-containing protein [Subtercola endophyticus]